MATRFFNESTGSEAGKLNARQASRPAAAVRRRRWVGRVLLAVTATTVFAPLPGCMIANGIRRSLSRTDSLDEFMLSYRNRTWAARAWLCSKHQFAGHPYLSDFETGFRQGYEDVANGENGCLPTVCPRQYWGWQYQSADGQGRMNAWFEGYPLGVRAAEQDGIGHWSHVATSLPPVEEPKATEDEDETDEAAVDAAVDASPSVLEQSFPLPGVDEAEPLLAPPGQPVGPAPEPFSDGPEI